MITESKHFSSGAGHADSGGYSHLVRVLFVCHGNICRSTMCQSVFSHMVKQRGLENRFVIDSAATSDEETGNPPHHGTVRKLREEGIPLIDHRARRVCARDYERFDYIIGMDGANIRNLNRFFGGDPENKVSKLLSYAGSSRDIADPWYTGNFDETYSDITEGLNGFLKYLEANGLV